MANTMTLTRRRVSLDQPFELAEEEEIVAVSADRRGASLTILIDGGESDDGD